MGLIDTHCHLDAAEFALDRAECLSAARAAGVGAWVVPGVSVQEFPAVAACVRETPGVFPAYGIHPLYVMEAQPEHIAQLADWLDRESPVAVGEIGLDFYVPGLDPIRQTDYFTAQLKLARARNLPVILHSRRAVDAVLKHLRRIPVPGGIAHAFNGSQQQAEQFIALGFKLGFGGAMTYSGSTRIRALAASLPLESIVLETDAPDIPPAWLNGARNTPDQLPAMAQVLADLRHCPVEDIIAATSANARQVLRLPATAGDQ